MIVLHHSDMDGKCSAAIVKKFADDRIKTKKCKFYSMGYDDVVPFNDIDKNELVFIVDFSLQKDGDFEKLLSITNRVFWIDHHESAIKKNKHLSDRLKGIRDITKAGCQLTWEYLFKNAELPLVVKLLADYDMWNFDDGDDAELFQLATNLYDTSPDNDALWDEWFNNDDEQITLDIKYGKLLKKYNDKNNDSIMKSYSFNTIFESYKAICCNTNRLGSKAFDSIDKNTFDIMIPFCFNGKLWKYSIYSHNDEIDCSKIAVKYGGGGHKGAAGFSSDKLLLKDK